MVATSPESAFLICSWKLQSAHVSILYIFLIKCGNPRPVGVVMWTGYAGPEWAWPLWPLTAISYLELLPQRRGGGECSEQISKVITHDMALPISHCMGSQVPVQSAGWAYQGGSVYGNPSHLWLYRLRNHGTERAKGSCSPNRDDPAKNSDIGFDGPAERPNVD